LKLRLEQLRNHDLSRLRKGWLGPAPPGLHGGDASVVRCRTEPGLTVLLSANKTRAGFRTAAFGPRFRTAAFAPGFRRRGFGFGYPFVAGVGLGLAASYPYYYSAYYSDPCLVLDPYYGWVNVCPYSPYYY
jgi:hypothetical protein